MMKQVKRILGLIWMITGPLAIFFLIFAAYKNIELQGKSDINKPIPWVIIISIFTPIAAGLSIFGWYAWKGEYDEPAKG